MGLLIAYVLLALGVSFLCSVMEAVLLSISPAYVGALERENHPMAERLRAYKAQVDRPLAAILSLNTVAHTVGAAGAGAQAQVVFGEAWLAVASAVLTLLILVVSEIIPKTLGATYWRQLGPLVTRLLGPVILLTLPLVWMSDHITALIARGGGGGHTTQMSREELTALADLGQRHGLMEKAESEALRSLLAFGGLVARDAMTPRTVMVTFPRRMNVAEALEAQPELHFSRIPLMGDGLDEVEGYVLKSDLLLAAAEDAYERPLTELIRPIRLVGEDVRLWTLMQTLLTAREHVAIVVDEYGALSGLITIEDLVETLLGTEIVDEVDTVSDMQALARERWQRRAERLKNGVSTPTDPASETS